MPIGVNAPSTDFSPCVGAESSDDRLFLQPSTDGAVETCANNRAMLYMKRGTYFMSNKLCSRVSECRRSMVAPTSGCVIAQRRRLMEQIRRWRKENTAVSAPESKKLTTVSQMKECRSTVRIAFVNWSFVSINSCHITPLWCPHCSILIMCALIVNFYQMCCVCFQCLLPISDGLKFTELCITTWWCSHVE